MSEHNNPPNRPGRILTLSISAVCLAMIVAVWWYYTVQKAENEESAERTISAVAATESSHLSNWRLERQGDGRLLQTSAIADLAARILSQPARRDTAVTEMLDLMRRLADAFHYSDVMLVDSDGSVVVRLNDSGLSEAPLKQSLRRQLAQNAIQANDAILSDLAPDSRTKGPLMEVTVPVNRSGALILVIDPSVFIYPYLKQWPGSTNTAETMLVRRDGDHMIYLSPTRFPSDRSLFLRRPIPLKLPREDVLATGWQIRSKDYRGVDVLATVQSVAGSPWYLICKMDVAEANLPMYRLGWEMSILTGFIAIISVIGGALVWKAQQANISREREEWFFAATNDTPALLWIASPDGKPMFVNRPFREFLGIDPEVSPDWDWADYIHPEDRVRVLTQYGDAVRNTAAYANEFRMRRFDGLYRIVVVEAEPRFAPGGELAGYAGSVADINGRRLAERELRSANRRLQIELAERTEREREIRSLSARLIMAREDERKRLALELHDDLNQQIGAVSLGIGGLRRKIPAGQSDAREQSDLIQRRLVQVSETIRRISHELHPAVLEYSGLRTALQSLCEEFSRLTGIRVSFHSEGAFEDLSPALNLTLYRIVQEALQNVAKHAQAETAEVDLRRTGNELRLAISDSGNGMDAEISARPGGLGLTGIRERARLVGGELTINSVSGSGTVLIITVIVPFSANPRKITDNGPSPEIS